MAFPAIFKQQKQIENADKNSAEKLLLIVQELLNKENPNHRLQHHILLTANQNLEILKNTLNQHRQHINIKHHIGQYHKDTYDQLCKLISDLQTLVDCYMEIRIDSKQMNHRLMFYHDCIDYLYTNFTEMNNKNFSTQNEALFWDALKKDVLEIARKVL